MKFNKINIDKLKNFYPKSILFTYPQSQFYNFLSFSIRRIKQIFYGKWPYCKAIRLLWIKKFFTCIDWNSKENNFFMKLFKKFLKKK